MNTKSTELTTAAATWVGLAKTTVKKMKSWLVTPGTYTAVTAGNGATHGCNGTAATEITSSVATVDLCQALCDAKKAWKMNAGDTLPEGAVAEDGASGTTHCYGIAF